MTWGSAAFKERPHLWGEWSAREVPQDLGRWAGAGAGLRHHPPGPPPPPARPNSTPGKAARIKARGRSFCPRSTPPPRTRAERGYTRLLGPRCGAPGELWAGHRGPRKGSLLYAIKGVPFFFVLEAGRIRVYPALGNLRGAWNGKGEAQPETPLAGPQSSPRPPGHSPSLE